MSEEMTREKAIEELSILLNKYQDGYFGDALDMAIEALEQEPFINKPCVSEKVCEHDKNVVIDKIRAEIEEYQKDAFYYNEVMISRKMVLAIIDKYKAESEVSNAYTN